jgi:hypothetical protein
VPREQIFSRLTRPAGHPRSLTCAGLGLKLRNLTPDYKFCSHVAFRGALGYRGTLRCRSDSGDKAVSTGSQSRARLNALQPLRSYSMQPQKARAIEV